MKLECNFLRINASASLNWNIKVQAPIQNCLNKQSWTHIHFEAANTYYKDPIEDTAFKILKVEVDIG